MTPKLRDLMYAYGSLHITMSTMEQERASKPHPTVEEYDESLGKSKSGEELLVVRVSADGGSRVINDYDGSLPDNFRELHGDGNVSVMELPEDEYHFFRAFRPGIINLRREIPLFLMQMALVHAYTLFEDYAAEVLRQRFRAHPAQIGLKKQITFSEVLEYDSKSALIDHVLENEVRQVMYLPILGVLETLRNRLGLREMTCEYDVRMEKISLMRNCIVHNAARVDQKLSACDSSMKINDIIVVSMASIYEAIRVCRSLSVSIDAALESLSKD